MGLGLSLAIINNSRAYLIIWEWLIPLPFPPPASHALLMVTFQDSLVSIDVHQVIYIWVQFTTRLISIVTKPIKVAVVVVVIVVVFVKKKVRSKTVLSKNLDQIFDPKNFWSKNNPCSKTFRPKSVGSKRNLCQKKFVHKKFWSKK